MSALSFFNSLPGNPLTAAGLEKRKENVSPGAFSLSEYYRSLPGNPLTPSGLYDRLSDSGNLDPTVEKATTAKERVRTKKPSGGSAPVASGDSAKALDYLNADLAKYYGMSPETAYSEALSNTAYQRAVKDMQAAGLNPAVLFGAGRASTADGVNYIKPASDGSGGSGRSYSGSGKKGFLFSQGAYGAISAAAGLVGMVFSKNPTGYWIGSQTAKGIMGALNSLSK